MEEKADSLGEFFGKRLNEFAEFAAYIGGEVKKGKDAQTACHQQLLARLLTNLADEAIGSELKSTKCAFKAIQGLAILIACEANETSQEALLKSSFFSLLDRSDQQSRLTRHFILCELAYLDQYLATFPLRQRLERVISREVLRSLDKNGYGRSPVLMDYAAGWRLLESIKKNLDARKKLKIGPSRDQVSPEIFVVGSVKGGVGKSVSAVALANFLLEQDARKGVRNPSVALVDLDASGPTLQFNLNVQKVATALTTNLVRPAPRSEFWSYPTILDIQGSPNTPENFILEVGTFSDTGRLYALALPDSLTVTGLYVAPQYFERDFTIDLLDILESLFSALARPPYNVDRIVLDFGPGVFGTNGTLFKFLSENYKTSLMLMCSPRSFDIANSLYEGIWLSARDFLPWHRNVLQLLNMWNEGDHSGVECSLTGSPDRVMGGYVNRYFNSILDGDFNANRTGFDGSSGKSIMFWRLRSYVYKIAMDSAERGIERTASSINPLRYDVKTLPNSEVIRTLLHPTELGGIDRAALVGSDWYQALEDHLLKWI